MLANLFIQKLQPRTNHYSDTTPTTNQTTCFPNKMFSMHTECILNWTLPIWWLIRKLCVNARSRVGWSLLIVVHIVWCGSVVWSMWSMWFGMFHVVCYICTKMVTTHKCCYNTMLWKGRLPRNFNVDMLSSSSYIICPLIKLILWRHIGNIRKLKSYIFRWR